MSFLRVFKFTYICSAFGIHPILCVWGLTFREETTESPPFFYTLTVSPLACLFQIHIQQSEPPQPIETVTDNSFSILI